MSESSIAEKLREGLHQASATERRIAHRLLSEYPIAGLQSATELARDVGVSTPSVLRLATRLGYSSYMDFQRALRDELAAQLSTPLSKYAGNVTVDGATTDFAVAVQNNIRETFANLSTTEFQSVAQLLANPRSRVHLVGGRFTDALALYLSVQLRILRPNVNHLQDQESNWRDQLLDMGKHDVLVIFDIRRYQTSLMRLATAAASRQVRIILLTDQWLSPIVKVSKHVISARIAVPSVWDSSAALIALSEALLAEVSQLGGERSRKRIKELEDMNNQT